MNLISKWCMALIVIGSLTISCEQEKVVKSSPSRIDKLTNLITSSSEFKNLNISLSDLNIGGAHFTNAKEDAVVISFAGMDGKKGVITLFNKKSDIRTVAYFEAITDTSPDLIYSKIKDGSFSGSFVFGNEFGSVQLNLKNSKIISKVSRKNTNARIAWNGKCNGITEQGGAMDCAGERIAQMNWFDTAVCYATFPECFAQQVISCAIDGCVTMNPN